MNCPVCKRKVEFEIPEEDIYYDCSYCQSSLLFSKGKCLIINAEQTTTENNLTDNEKLQTNQENKTNLFEETLEKTGISLSEKDSEQSKTKTLFAEESKSEHLQADDFKSAISAETSDEKRLDKKSDFESQNETTESEENKRTEEDFYPNEKTGVPELQSESKELEQQTKNLTDQKKSSDEVKASFHELDSNNFIDEASPSHTASADFSDVAEFAKNQEEQTKGLYLYDLTLSEINSQTLKEEVLTVLKDSYLNLPQDAESFNLQDIMDKGKIKIPRISPIQTYIIIQSLMGLPLNIHWDQHHIADE